MLRYLPLLVALLAIFLWRNLRLTINVFTLPPYPVGYYHGGDFNTRCHIIKEQDMKFCEDVVFWDLLDADEKLSERHLILGCDPGRLNWNTVMGPLQDPDPHGALWIYTPSAGDRPQRLVLEGYPAGHDFHPLGLDVWPSHAYNASALFVINHARERTVIEQFLLSPAKPAVARWVRTIAHPFFVSPNSLALTSPTSFYVSNDHLVTRRVPVLGHVLPFTESVLALPLSWLAHVSLDEDSAGHSNGGSTNINHTFVALGVPFANGVALSPDGKQVALASTTLQQVMFYSRDPISSQLTQTHTVPLPFCADNVRYDDSGVLLVAGHPHFPSLIRVAAQKSSEAPSWVVTITPHADVDGHADEGSERKGLAYDVKAPVSAATRIGPVSSHDVETVFQSNGTGFSSSSTGIRDTRTGILYVTGLYEDGLLVCQP